LIGDTCPQPEQAIIGGQKHIRPATLGAGEMQSVERRAAESDDFPSPLHLSRSDPDDFRRRICQRSEPPAMIDVTRPVDFCSYRLAGHPTPVAGPQALQDEEYCLGFEPDAILRLVVEGPV
jgi:hypothetical protein